MSAQVDPLVEPSELSRWGVPSAFLAQFEPRPIDVKISTGGALGAMAFAWKWAADGVDSYSDPIVSDAGASFAFTLEDAFAVLTFAAGTYTANTVYRVTRAGTVSGGSGLTVERLDVRALACGSVTAEAMTLMRDAVRPPLVSWSDDIRTHAAAMVYAILKRRVGATPAESGGAGDQNVFFAEEAARRFFSAIGKMGKPDGVVDASSTSDGPLIARYPSSRSLRGW